MEVIIALTGSVWTVDRGWTPEPVSLENKGYTPTQYGHEPKTPGTGLRNMVEDRGNVPSTYICDVFVRV